LHATVTSTASGTSVLFMRRTNRRAGAEMEEGESSRGPRRRVPVRGNADTCAWVSIGCPQRRLTYASRRQRMLRDRPRTLIRYRLGAVSMLPKLLVADSNPVARSN